MDQPWTRVAGTAHRELRNGDALWVADQLPRAAAWLRDNTGTRIGISGLALGGDMDWAEAVLAAGMDLWVAIPYIEQAARWSVENKTRWARLRAAATRERIVGEFPADLPAQQRSGAANRLLHKRNVHMLDVAVAVLTIWEPGRLDGGTAAALRHADKRRMPGVHLDPVNRVVHFELPAADQLERCALQSTTCGHVAKIGSRAFLRQDLALMTAAGFFGWRIRPAHTRESWDDGCDDCLAELAAAANDHAHAYA